MAAAYALDHVVLLVGELESAQAEFQGRGFTTLAGGEHPALGTHNALVPFADDSYLELIAFRPGARIAEPTDAARRFLSWAQRGPGLVDFALLPGGGIEAAIEAAWSLGCPMLGPLPGHRVRPDGARVEWQLGLPDAPELPFLCADVTPRELRVPTGEARTHACGAAGIANVTVAVKDLEASARSFGALLGSTAREVDPNEAHCSRSVRFDLERTSITLTAPESSDSPLRELLVQRGQGPCAVDVRTSDPRKVGPIDVAAAAGATLRFVLAAATALLCLLFPAPELAAQSSGETMAGAYTQAIRRINEEHARKPGKTRESELAKRLPRASRSTLAALLKAKDSPALLEALVACGEAAADLDLADDFRKVRERLASSPEHASRLGTMLSRERFILRGHGGLDDAYLERFAGVLEAILAGYDELFGFAEWSKVPGKKLRMRLELVPRIERPPHFAPEHDFHSEIVFPVVDGAALKSPTADGKFLFYGLCHELGHVIAMWGDRTKEEDRHTWAHYTGVLLVDHLSAQAKSKPILEELRDAQWRSLGKEREKLAATEPGTGSADGVMALWIALHDGVGPKAIGAAINLLDREDRRLRIHRVRYYKLHELRAALLRTLKEPEKRKVVEGLLPTTVEAEQPKR
jgi:hypothetical protein